MDYKGIKFQEVIAGIDVGYRDESAFIVIGFDGDKYYILDEIIVKESTTSELAALIKEKLAEWPIENIYIDSAAQQVKADFAYDYDIYCDNSVKSVNDGINFIQNLIEKDKLYFDENNANYTFKAMTAYKWKEKTERPKPHHDWASHPCDSVRYAIYTHHKNNAVNIYSR